MVRSRRGRVNGHAKPSRVMSNLSLREHPNLVQVKRTSARMQPTTTPPHATSLIINTSPVAAQRILCGYACIAIKGVIAADSFV